MSRRVFLFDIRHLGLVRDALKESHFADANWFDLGLKLKLSYPQLKSIKDSCLNDPSQCLLECLSLWLMSASTRTWETLAIALERMHQNATAQHIRKIYGNPASQILQHYSDRISQVSLTDSCIQLLYTEGLITEETQRKIERCGGSLSGSLRELMITVSEDHSKLRSLGDILLKFEETKSVAQEMINDCEEFLDIRAIGSSSSMIPTASVDVPVRSESSSMRASFARMILKVSKAIVKKSPPLDDLKTIVSLYKRNLRDKLDDCDSVSGVVSLIQEECNIADIELLQTVVEELDVTEAERYIEQYKKALENDAEKEITADAAVTSGTMKKWCEEGTIELTLTRVHMVGPPGSGKTCTQCLLLNKDPPKHDPRPTTDHQPPSNSHTLSDHISAAHVIADMPSDHTPSSPLSKSITKSTPIACKAVKALRVSINNDDEIWEAASRNDLLERLASDLKRSKNELDHEVSQQKKRRLKSSGLPSLLSQLESGSAGASAAGEESSQVEFSAENNSGEEEHSNLLKEIVNLIPEAKAQLSDKWVYIVDSGGQPAYQELLPLFTRAASLNIITIDLSKNLDEKFKFMYRINGKEFKCDEKMEYSNRELFKFIVSSTTLRKPLNLSYEVTKSPQHSMNFVVGTHYDILVKKFGEIMAEKKVLQMSEELMSPRTLMPYLTNYIISNVQSNSMTVPVNTLLTNSEERTQASKILTNTISDCVEVSLTVKLPIRCFTFELYLESKAESKAFLTRNEAVQEGKKLYMSEADVDEALAYLHNCTIILYYPEVEPKLVFCDPQRILDILSHLLALTYVDNRSAQSFAKGIEQKEIVNLKNRGHFQEALLKKFTEVFSEEFQPKYFINLLKHLHIIAELEYSNGEVCYFLPSVLPAYDNSFNTTASVKPLLFVWIKNTEMESCLAVPVPQGIFHLLIVRLLTQKEYKVQFPIRHRMYRDAIMLWISINKKRYTLQIINCSTHIEVHFIGVGSEVYSPQIRELLTTAVNKSSDSINVKHNYVYAFPCLNASTSDTNESEKCYCIVDDDEKRIVNCTLCLDPVNISEDDRSYWCWFGVDYDSQVVSSSITNHSLDLTHLYDLRMLLKRSQFSNAKWFDFGIALHLHYDTLKTIEANYPRDINSCLRECLVKWLERADDVDKYGGANWTTLIQALEESEQKTPAEHIRCERLKRSKPQADEELCTSCKKMKKVNEVSHETEPSDTHT